MTNLFFFLAVLIGLSVFLNHYYTYYQGPISSHFDGKYFTNPTAQKNSPSFLTALKWKLTSTPGMWPKEMVENLYSDIPPDRIEGSDLRISWVGHCTYLIQTQGINILTDPVWSDRASPFSFIGPKRVHAPGIAFEKLPQIDIVLISHNHYDHLDIETIKKLKEKHNPKFIVPLGNDTIIHRGSPKAKVEALDLEESVTITDLVKIHLEPAHHWSARSLFDKNRALWGSFVIETPDGPIYVAGDTGYAEGIHFKNAYKKYGAFRLALLPIGAHEPRWIMKEKHMTPEESVFSFKALNASYAAPSHHSTFLLADDGYDEGVQEMKNLYQRHPEILNRFILLSVGQHWFVPLKM